MVTVSVAQPLHKPARSWGALALLCGLAVACTVMYVTTDGEDIQMETILSSETSKKESGPALDFSKEIKVVSTDVEKVGIIYTDVPKFKGRIRLIKYFEEIEASIASEVASRKKDIAHIKDKMQKNREYNAKERKKMKTSLLAQMAVNAKKAKDDLDEQMRKTAKTFAENAKAENARAKLNRKRFKANRKVMRANKRAARAALTKATRNQHRALSALNAETNAHIAQSEKNIAANAVQIKVNAKKARDALDKANKRFNRKMFATREEAANSRSKLVATANSMDKKTRAMIAGKVSAEIMAESAQFDKIRKTMAKDRATADAGLKDMSTKLSGSLNAMEVLNDKNFASTVQNIQAAKDAATKAVNEAKKMFKLKMMTLEATATQQVTKLKKQQNTLKGQVTKNKLDQAEVSRHVNAEIKRMIKLGNDHEAALAKKDGDLEKIMDKNRLANKNKMTQMANRFNSAMNKIKEDAKKARAHAESRLKTECGNLYKTLAANDEAQKKVNEKVEQATTQMKLDAADALRTAKAGFAKKLGSLTATVIKNDKKADKAVKKLVGIVDADAVKNKEGRDALRDMAKTNKLNMETAIRNAISAGEQRALAVEKRAKTKNEKTLGALNMRITAEIGTLRKELHGSIEDLRLSTKEAREGMKREILGAVRDSAKTAKDNLAKAVKDSNQKIAALNKKFEDNEKSSSAARALIQKSIVAEKKLATDQIISAVKTQNKALLALKTLTAEKIKATNKNVEAYGKAIEANAKAVGKQMKANILALEGKLVAAKNAAKSHLTKKNSKAIARHVAALESVKNGIAAAQVESDKKFTKAYGDMGKARDKSDKDLSDASIAIQKTLAKNSALYDAQFRHTVKNIAAARKAAAGELADARKDFSTEINTITTVIKETETKLSGAIALVSTETANMKNQQRLINRKVDAEIKRIFTLSDTRATEAREARGQLRRVIDSHKTLALNERNALAKRAQGEIKLVRSEMAKIRSDAASDLTKSTKKLNIALSDAKEKQDLQYKGLKGALAKAQLSTSQAVTRAKKEFSAKLTTLTNTVTLNHQKYEKALTKVTGVAHDWKKASGKDRKLLRKQIGSMEKDLNKAIVRAIEIGEAKAIRVQERALGKIGPAATMLINEIGEQVEAMADDVFSAVNTNRAKIADNYLALKAYCGSKQSDIIEYVGTGKANGLFSLGDLMSTVARMAAVHTKDAEGIGAGGDKVPEIFAGGHAKVSRKLTKTNGLVNEWAKTINEVRQRWPYGLGHYLLSKAMFAMQDGGLLTVGKSGNKAGQYVYINAHAVGLSNRLSDFDKLASKKIAYQKSLMKITAKQSKHKAKKAPMPKKGGPIYVAAPEWQGN